MEVKVHAAAMEVKRPSPDCRTCKNLYLGHKCVSATPCKDGDKHEQREPLHLWKENVYLQRRG